MKERILSFLLAILLVIGLFAGLEAIRGFGKVANETSNLEGDKTEVQTIEFTETGNKVVEETHPVEETVERLEETQEIESTQETEETQETESTQETEVTQSNEETQKSEENNSEATNSELDEDDYSEEIVFKSEYVSGNEVMPYALYTPSTIDTTKKTPLIVWLHGSGEVGKNADTFMVRGLPKVMSKWALNGFDAYVICPHLTGNWNTGKWNAENSKNNLKNLLDYFIEQHNIDTDRIIVVGHSLGGQGALYMAHELDEYFKRCVVLSGYNSGIDINEITIPTKVYVGTTGAGEDSASVNYTTKYLLERFGENNVLSIQASHGDIPFIVFHLDNDGDSNSDLVEWMLE